MTAVETSPDLRSARVFVSVLGTEEEREATLAALRSATRRHPARDRLQLTMKRTPALTFRYDDTVEQAARLSRMLEE